ncbi:MAG: four helix bundle protein [Cytophagaceae bacterium]
MENGKFYDLEERTFRYAKEVCLFCKGIDKSISNTEYYKQVIRSSASVGANYIEANESLGPKDFLMKVRISRREVKESIFWLRLIKETNKNVNSQLEQLLDESTQLKKILSSIIEKSKASSSKD